MIYLTHLIVEFSVYTMHYEGIFNLSKEKFDEFISLYFMHFVYFYKWQLQFVFCFFCF